MSAEVVSEIKLPLNSTVLLQRHMKSKEVKIATKTLETIQIINIALSMNKASWYILYKHYLLKEIFELIL